MSWRRYMYCPLCGGYWDVVIFNDWDCDCGAKLQRSEVPYGYVWIMQGLSDDEYVE